MSENTIIPETEWKKIQKLSERIKHRAWEQEEDIENLNNFLHALHGEGVRDSKYTGTGRPAAFIDGKWVGR